MVHQPKAKLRHRIKTLDSLIAQWQWKVPEDSSIQHIDHALFPFDPNTASTTELIQLGFAPTLAKRIDNYRNKKGRFKLNQIYLKSMGWIPHFMNDSFRLLHYRSIKQRRSTKVYQLRKIPITVK
ncbi:MAG: helix-hairpin-helix domain-containing protein [Flammeovirgaceae bacterium]|nr:helix-hairpin-helix domain-containing protein [Flammeovirgaceae bacterium]